MPDTARHRADIASHVAALLRTPKKVREAWLSELLQQSMKGGVWDSTEWALWLIISNVNFVEGFLIGMAADSRKKAADRN